MAKPVIMVGVAPSCKACLTKASWSTRPLTSPIDWRVLEEGIRDWGFCWLLGTGMRLRDGGSIDSTDRE